MAEAQTKKLIKAYMDFSRKIDVLKQRQGKIHSKLKKYMDAKDIEKLRKQLNS